MAISKKGLRKIAVGEEVYHWKFVSNVMIFSDKSRNGILTVDFGYFDVWDYVNDQENRPPDFEPKVITPKFVKESILFAINNGWNGDKMNIEFKDSTYKVN